MTLESEKFLDMDFAAPPIRVNFKAFLFDMDGTIIDSTAAVEKHWQTYVLASVSASCFPGASSQTLGLAFSRR